MSSKSVAYDGGLSGRRKLISAEDYQRMGTAGVFSDQERIELIDGQIYTMSPFTPLHNGHVDKISHFFNRSLINEILVRTQGSIRTDEYSEPEPDITILRFDEKFYSEKQASPKDIHLVIEVAISTVQTDQSIKKVKYAEAGIPEYWIVLPEHMLIEVYRNPKGNDYQEKMTYDKTSEWIFEAFNLSVKGSDLLIG